jgi:hypothetical protein
LLGWRQLYQAIPFYDRSARARSIINGTGRMTSPDQAPLSLITPSHRRDFERSALLCESIDKHVSGFAQHYLIVNDEDVTLFKALENAHRSVLPASQFLPKWLHEIPKLRWKRRRYWWSLRAPPVSGWHTQQLIKIQAVAALPADRFCLIDSDNVFFRDFDAATLAAPQPLRVHVNRGGAAEDHPLHMKWVASAHRLLGMAPPQFPADDYIDNIVLWDQAVVRAMIARIEKITGGHWAQALCRARDFAEYMLYGIFIVNAPELRERFYLTTDYLCCAHWTDNALDEAQLIAMLKSSSAKEVALCVQSFGSTPVPAIRRSLEDFRTKFAEAAV